MATTDKVKRAKEITNFCYAKHPNPGLLRVARSSSGLLWVSQGWLGFGSGFNLMFFVIHYEVIHYEVSCVSVTKKYKFLNAID